MSAPKANGCWKYGDMKVLSTTSSIFFGRQIRDVANTIHVGHIGSLATDKPLLGFVIDPDLLKGVDDFRYRNRFPTRAAAIRWLLAWALDQKPAVPKAE